MIRSIIRHELAEHPGRAMAATVATVLAVPLIWALYVVVVVALDGLGVPR